MSAEPDPTDLKGQLADLQQRLSRLSAVQRQLIDTRDHLDRALERFAGIQFYNSHAIAVRDPEVFAAITAEAVVELFDLAFGLLWLTAPDGTLAAQPVAAVGIEPAVLSTAGLGTLLGSERFRHAQTGLWGPAELAVVGDLGLAQLVASTCVGPDETTFALVIGGVMAAPDGSGMTAGGGNPHRGLGAEQLESLTVFAQQVGALLQNRRDQAIIEHQRELAEAANRAKSEFLATVNHELLTPMNGVLGMLETLQDKGPNPDQAQDIATARRSAQHLLALIKNILTLSEIEAGRLVPQAGPFDPAQVLTAAALPFAERMAAKGLAYQVVTTPGLPATLHGDQGRLGQILEHLIRNAHSFTDSGSVGVIIAGTPLPDGRWELALTVQDTGIGIAPETQARLFTPFTQADASPARRYGGSGLGLAICRRLLDLMGGRIWMESRLGAGCRCEVRLALPVVAPQSAAAPDLVPPVAIPPGGQTVIVSPDCIGTVLLVDDNIVGQKVTGAMLARLGLKVQVAGNGRQALECYAQGGIAIVLMDVQMPGMDGLEATRRLRVLEAERAWPRTPVLALTANTMAEDRDACLTAGMDDFIARPASKAALTETLARWLPL
ncbi:MAG TPA: ATP-binding protein [Lamprocystis sp. (in: g-proteobacteria)]|nr:ATP-binding protein [Lamprocystis sp. (in: g-proteobacteria)]